jgi:hypothetical protein
MSYNSNIRDPFQQLEYQKFVEIQNDARFPPVSVVSWEYADSSNAAVSSMYVYPKYGVITYLANAADINLVLSASEVDIGNVGMLDNSTNPLQTVYAQIVNDQPNGSAGALMGSIRVRTQEYPQLNALTAKDFATDASLRALTAVTYNNIVTNTVAISTAQTLPISGSVTVLNPVTSVQVNGSVATNFNPTQVDAFNRLRTSSPLTLFDSSHRYRDNNLWSTLSANGGSVSFNLTQGLVDLNVTNAAGASALRETTKVFSYQPGKSLLVMNTFVMDASANGLVQRAGYFGDDNGIYFQMNDDVISFVERSIVTGSRVEIVVPRSSWNGDKLDGTGPSGIVLDITKAQIQWMDIEWLGVGTIRVGFVINGQFIVCHSFHHANIINTTYITTASLPLRYEIFNKSATSGSKTLKQICSSVISEGGYELRGLQQSVDTPITTPKSLTTAGTYYPVLTMRLKSNRLDAIVILTALSLMGTGTGIYSWKVIASGATAGGTGTWISAGVDSGVEYKLDATSVTGGRTLASGFFTANAQGAPSIDILKEALFTFQLERDGFTKTPYELTIAVAASTDTELVYGSADWEEISR